MIFSARRNVLPHRTCLHKKYMWIFEHNFVAFSLPLETPNQASCCPGCFLEPVFTRNICGFSSIILLQTRKKYAGGLSPGKCFLRSMQQNLPKRHVYTLVKTGSYFPDSSRTSTTPCRSEITRVISMGFAMPSPILRERDTSATPSTGIF